jgi:hypothetical protein
MKGNHRMRLLLASTAFAAALAATSAGAVSLIPLTDNPGGQTPEASAEQWSRWSFSFDQVADGGDPITDDTGKFQNMKQEYPVFLLGGTPGGSVVRTFTAKAGKPFMIPMINGQCLGNELYGLCYNDPYSYLRNDTVNRLFLTINGVTFVDANSEAEVDAIESAYRIDTDVFYDVYLAPNNWTGLPEEVFLEGYNSGFYAFANLPVGIHTLVFGGGYDNETFGTFFNSVTATITVAPVPLPAALPLLAAGLGALGFAARRRTPS